MGIVKKQAYKNTIISYLGMVIGYVNVLLFTHFFATEKYGLYVLLGNLSVLYSLIASMGVPSIVVKYFPFFKTTDRAHKGFFYWVGKVSLGSFLVITVVYLLAKPLVVDIYIKQSPLFIDYFYVLIPLSAFVIFFNLFEAAGKVIYNTIYSAFLKEIVLKGLTTAAILVYAGGYINFWQFILLYVGANGLIALLLLISMITTGEFKITFKTIRGGDIKTAEMANYGLFALLSSSVFVLWQKMDVVMLSAMKGLEITAVYGFYTAVAIVISVPSSALSRTTYQIVADSWKSKNMKAIGEIYSKTSIIQMIFGCLLFIGVIVNKHNLFNIISKKDYIQHFDLFIVIGLGFLVDITGGLNTFIMSSSHKYRLTTVLVIISSVLCLGLTYVLIKLLGGMGAAIAYLITISLFNFATWFYIRYRFKLQPFTYKHLIVIAITTISFFAGKYLWTIPNTYADLAVRSLVTGGIYMALIYFLHVSVDINEKIDGTFTRALKFIK